MLINQNKLKTTIFDFIENHKFTTRLKLKDENIEVIKSTRLLGTILTDDLKWDQNTKNIIKKANARMQLLHKIANFGTPKEDLKTVYILFVRSILEQSATVWHSSLSEENSRDLERVQKSAVKLILKENYKGYENGLAQLGLDKLKDRRENLCLEFARRCLKHKKLKHMFPENVAEHQMKTRKHEKYKVEHANTKRFQNSAVIYMQKLLNKMDSE